MLYAQVIINGILLGGLYTCMAIGFSLIWGVMNIINLAHGSLIILGAYISYVLNSHFGVDPILSIPFSATALFLFGYLLQRHVINMVMIKSVFLTLIVTFGLNMVLVNFNIALFSADVRSITTWYSGLWFEIWGVRLAYTRVLVFVIALVLTIALYAYLKWSASGRAIRATAQNPDAAHVLGVDTGRAYAMTFALGCAMAGISGSLFSVVYAFSPVVGDPFTLKSFVIVILGGLGNIFSVVVASVFLGVTENLISAFGNPGYRDAVSFGLLVVVLILRPTGFLGKHSYASARA